MDLKTYEEIIEQFAVYPKRAALEYLTLGLGSEVGEVQGVVKKHIRTDYDLDVAKKKLKKELGDVAWYWVRLCTELDLDPGELLQQNVDKLTGRLENCTIKGDGDDR